MGANIAQESKSTQLDQDIAVPQRRLPPTRNAGLPCKTSSYICPDGVGTRTGVASVLQAHDEEARDPGPSSHLPSSGPCGPSRAAFVAIRPSVFTLSSAAEPAASGSPAVSSARLGLVASELPSRAASLPPSIGSPPPPGAALSVEAAEGSVAGVSLACPDNASREAATLGGSLAAA